MGGAELIVIVFLLLMLPMLGIWIWMLVDCASNERGEERVPWLLVVIFAGFIGALIYMVVRRPKRLAAARQVEAARTSIRPLG